MFKKGQAAMEFLMTYGWAILVVLIAIGALAYFGVLNPSKFLPNSCTIAPGVACTEFKATNTNSNITLILSNGKGVDLNFTGVTFRASASQSCSALSPGASVTIADGGTGAISIANCNAQAAGMVGSVGSRLKADISLTYIESGSTLGQRVFSGSMVTKVEA